MRILIVGGSGYIGGALTDILRNDWGYEGLIITDALEMGALTSTTWHEESAIRAVEAGSDIILLPLDGVGAINSIYNAVIDGRLDDDDKTDAYRWVHIYDRLLGEKSSD